MRMFPDFEFHNIQGFVAVARTGNFTKAAEELGLSQSALSRSIQKLESQIGKPLFDRHPRHVTLTDVGKVFFGRSVEILSLVEESFREICESKDVGHIRLAAIPTIAPYFLPSLLRDFTLAFPKIRISVLEQPSRTIIKKCRNGEIDAAIMALPFPIETLDAVPLFEEELFLVLPSEHPLGSRNEITLQEIRKIPFVMLSEEHCLSDQVETFCRTESMQPITVERTSQLTTVQELVSLEHGISIVPAMARKLDQSESRIYRSFVEPRPTRTIALVTNSDRYQSPALHTFAEYLRKYRR